MAYCFERYAETKQLPLFANHSKEVAAFGIQLDYLGIVLLMWGSTIPTVYYGFYRDQHLQRCYWAMVSQGLL